MSKGINKVTLIGNAGFPPKLGYTPEGKPACNFSLGTSDIWVDKATGEKKSKTEWHKVILYDNCAINGDKFIKKGSKVYIEGKIKTRKYTDKSGIERHITEIIAFDMQVLDKQEFKQYEANGNVADAMQIDDDMDIDDEIPF